MVDDRAILELRSLWFPTRASGERSFWMNLEFSVNQIPKGSELSLAEVAWSTGSVEEALSLLPPIVPQDTRKKMARLLQPWPEGRYATAWDRSGGILNLFTPSWGEAQDEVWAGMVAGWKAETFPDEETRQEAFRALEQRWNTTPHPFFAGLTPAQVMVGGGTREADLATEFLENLARFLEGRPFKSEGQALITTVLMLRTWQNQPQQDGQTVFEVILGERSELLARRARVLGESVDG
jgi:hypothetical protein